MKMSRFSFLALINMIMARQIHRLTDANTGGGRITSIPQDTVYAENLLVSVNGSIGTSHPPCPLPIIHCQGIWHTANGSDTVFIHGIPVNRLGDADTCGHGRAMNNSTVFVE